MIIITKITSPTVTSVIDMGRQGENEAREVWFDLSWLIENYGEGTATVLCQRSKDDAPYLATITQDGKNAIWRITSLDTAYDGYGKCELRWTVGDTLAKTIIYKTVVLKSMAQDAEVPDPYQSWYDALIEYINDHAASPEQIAEAVEDYIDTHPITGAVVSVNNKTGEVTLTAEDVGALPDSTVIPSVDSTLSTSGAAADAKATGDEINQLKEEISQLSGLSEEVKVALLQIAQKVAYVDEHGQDYYDDLYDALYPPADLVSISAVYTQSGTVYDNDSLDSLKDDLVVTAHMSDHTTRTVTTYVLSGTLAEGTSTITVTYGGKTTTFSVIVTSAYFYALDNPTVFDGTNYIDTEFPLLAEDRTYSIVFDAQENNFDFSSKRYNLFTVNGSSGQAYLVQAYKDGNGKQQYQLIITSNNTFKLLKTVSSASNARIKGCITHVAGESTFTVNITVDGEALVGTSNAYSYIQNNNPIILGTGLTTGTKYFIGTMNDFRVYKRALSADEINAYMA